MPAAAKCDLPLAHQPAGDRRQGLPGLLDLPQANRPRMLQPTPQGCCIAGGQSSENLRYQPVIGPGEREQGHLRIGFRKYEPQRFAAELGQVSEFNQGCGRGDGPVRFQPIALQGNRGLV